MTTDPEPSIPAASLDAHLALGLRMLGGPGASWVSRLLPRNVGVEELELARPLDEVWSAVANLLLARGSPVFVTDAGYEEGASAVLGGGAARLNPTVVTAWATALGAGRTRLRIEAVAKEGLIRQRAGEKLAREIGDAMRAWVSTAS